MNFNLFGRNKEIKKSFLNADDIIRHVSIVSNDSITKCLLLYQSDNQRTYLMKSNTHFLIVNDNLDEIRIVCNKLLKNLNYIVNNLDNYNYTIVFEFASKTMFKITKHLFDSKEEIRIKIDSL